MERLNLLQHIAGRKRPIVAAAAMLALLAAGGLLYRQNLASRAAPATAFGLEEASYKTPRLKLSGWAPPHAEIQLFDVDERAATTADSKGMWDLSFDNQDRRPGWSLTLAMRVRENSQPVPMGQVKYFASPAAKNIAYIWWERDAPGLPALVQSPVPQQGELYLAQVIVRADHPLIFSGRAAPESLIYLYADGQLAGKARVDARGVWVLESLIGTEKKAAALRIDQIAPQAQVTERRVYRLSWPEDRGGEERLAVINAGDDGWILGEGAKGARTLYYLLKPEAGDMEAADKEFPGQITPVPPPAK